MDTRPLNTAPPLGCHLQDVNATEAAASVPWTVDANPTLLTTASTSVGSFFDNVLARQRARLPNGGAPSSLSPGSLIPPLASTETRLSQTPIVSAASDPMVIPYPAALFPPTLSPSTTRTSGVNRAQYLEIVSNPKFEDITRAVFIGRQIGEDQEKQRQIAEQHKRSMDSIHQSRQELQKQRRSTKSNAELDILLHHYLKLVQGLNQELVLTQNEANNACTMFEQQIKAITNSAAQMEGPVALSATDEDHLRQVLKRKYTDQIKHLSEEFRRKRKKGKLPVSATDVLRGWWENNLAWPYPSEDEKRTLAGQTDLSATQINNWFINQRKRHWHKFFKDGRLPQSPEEAMEILRSQGILP